MLIRGVVNNQVHDQAHTPVVHFFQQEVKIFHGPHLVHDCLVIPDVITVVIVGGIVDRRKPKGINAETLQVVKPRADTVDIADTIAVAVGKGAWINLVEDGFLPPGPGRIGIAFARSVLFQIQQPVKRLPESVIQVVASKFFHRADSQVGHQGIGDHPVGTVQLQ